MNLPPDADNPFARVPSAITPQSFSRRWSKWASGLFKRDKPLGSEPWFNPEAVTEQKREWLEQQKKAQEVAATWPEHIFENFFVLGLPPDIELTQVAEQLCERERKQRHHHNESDDESDHGKEYLQPPQPSFVPQVLFRYPPGSPAPISDDEVASLAFPAGVSPEKLRRTPSLSALDEIIMGRDSDQQQQCFVFMIKVAGNFPLYGCCWYIREMLHRPPYLSRGRYRSCRAPFRQCMIAAPRCYCLLSKYPFFELHFRVLKIVLDLERLERLLEYDSEKSQLPAPSMGVPLVPLSARTGRRSSALPDAPLLDSPAAPGAAPAASTGSVLQPGRSSTTGMHEQQQQQQQQPQQQLAVLLPDGMQQQCAVHNKQAYCSECAGIIEDMCPFTPGPAALQQPQQRTSGRLSGQLQQAQLQQRLSQSSSLHQPAAPRYCSVCGKQLGRLSEPDASTLTDAVAGAIATPLQGVGNGISSSSTGAAAGPLEAGTLGQLKEQQQQASAAAGFAASKAWVAAVPGAVEQHTQQQAQFDAIAAAVAGFDSAAAPPAAAADSATPAGAGAAAARMRASSSGGMAAASGPVDDRWANWQNVVAAIKSVSSGPLLPSYNSAGAGVGEGPLGNAASDPAPQMEEASMVQRMWEVWAPRTSLTGEQQQQQQQRAPRSSGSLVGFLRRSSRNSATNMMMPHEQQQQQLRQQAASVGGDASSSASSQQGLQAQQGAVSEASQQQPPGQRDLAPAGPVGEGVQQQQQQQMQQLEQQQEQQQLRQLQQQEQQGNDTHGGADGSSSAGTAASEASDTAGSSSSNSSNLVTAGNNAAEAAAAAGALAGADPDAAGAAGSEALQPTAVGEECLPDDLQPLRSNKGSSNSLRLQHLRTTSASSFHSALDAMEQEEAEADEEEERGQATAEDAAEDTAAAGRSGPMPLLQPERQEAQLQQQLESPFVMSLQQPQQPQQPEQQAGSPAVSPTRRTASVFATAPGSPAAVSVGSAGLGQPTSLIQLLPGSQFVRASSGDSSGRAAPALAAAAASEDGDCVAGLPQLSMGMQRSSSPSALGIAVVVAGAARHADSCSASGLHQQQNGEARVSSGLGDLTWTAVSCPSPASSTELPELGGGAAAWEANGSTSRDVTIGGTIPASVDAQQEQQQQGQLLCGSPRVSVMPAAPRKSSKDLFADVTARKSGDLSADLCKTISHLVQADSTSLLAAYRSSPVPLPGEMYRLTLGDLYRLEFERTLPAQQYAPPGRSKLQQDVLRMADVECAQQLQLWTVAALCRSLSLDNIMTLLNAVLLEKQLVVFCPHIGTLAAIVLALVPLLRPFAWQSLMLPVTPDSMLAFLEAPVPFVLGVQYKTPAVASRCHGLLRVNVYKNAIKNASFPSLPNARQLLQALTPHHAALCEAAPLAVERPVHVITPDEEASAASFLAVTHDYMSRLCGDLRLHTIVNVGMSKRTGVFMRDALIESLAAKDRPFMRAFTETQMFNAYADGVISDYCEA